MATGTQSVKTPVQRSGRLFPSHLFPNKIRRTCPTESQLPANRQLPYTIRKKSGAGVAAKADSHARKQYPSIAGSDRCESIQRQTPNVPPHR